MKIHHMTENLTKPGLMVRIADLMYRALKLACRRWYVTLMLTLISVLPVMSTLWKARKVNMGIAKLKRDNPLVRNWGNLYLWANIPDNSEDVSQPFMLSKSEFKDFISFTRLSSNYHLNLGRPITCFPFDSYRTNRNISEISNITALKGLPLGTLDLSATKVRDISSIKGMSLIFLDITDTEISDITVLKGMPLENLWLPNTAKDIGFLRSMKTLKYINGGLPYKFWKEFDKKGIIPDDVTEKSYNCTR